MLAGQVQLTRAEDGKGPVRLQLVTTQPMPKKKVKQNNKDVMVDDLERALRLDGSPELSADAMSSEFHLVTPRDLPQKSWGMVVKAELLSTDKKNVLATAYSDVHFLPRVSQQIKQSRFTVLDG